jgi:hypothetical protein
MNPGQSPAGSRPVIELGLLADPQDAERVKARPVHDELGAERHQRVPHLLVAVNDLGSRYSQVEHHQGHGHREDPVTERRQAFHALAGYLVMESVHSGRGP